MAPQGRDDIQKICIWKPPGGLVKTGWERGGRRRTPGSPEPGKVRANAAQRLVARWEPLTRRDWGSPGWGGGSEAGGQSGGVREIPSPRRSGRCFARGCCLRRGCRGWMDRGVPQRWGSPGSPHPRASCLRHPISSGSLKPGSVAGSARGGGEVKGLPWAPRVPAAPLGAGGSRYPGAARHRGHPAAPLGRTGSPGLVLGPRR